MPGARPASKSMIWPSIPMLCPGQPELGVPFSQLQKHRSFMHDWKKWWRGRVMTMLTSRAINACSLGHYIKCPTPIVLSSVRKSQTNTCPQTDLGVDQRIVAGIGEPKSPLPSNPPPPPIQPPPPPPKPPAPRKWRFSGIWGRGVWVPSHQFIGGDHFATQKQEFARGRPPN